MESLVEKKLLEAAEIVEDQIDAEIARLDRMEDDDLQALERNRAAHLRRQAKEKEELAASGHGTYYELADEAAFFEACKKSRGVVCHFYRSSTARCAIVDKHLALLAPRHIEARFCKIDVERAHFLVERLHVRVLPSVGLCRDGKMVDYIVGFDDLGGRDDFSTEMMEWRIARAKVIHYAGDLSRPPGAGKKVLGHRSKKTIRGGGGDDSDTD